MTCSLTTEPSEDRSDGTGFPRGSGVSTADISEACIPNKTGDLQISGVGVTDVSETCIARETREADGCGRVRSTQGLQGLSFVARISSLESLSSHTSQWDFLKEHIDPSWEESMSSDAGDFRALVAESASAEGGNFHFHLRLRRALVARGALREPITLAKRLSNDLCVPGVPIVFGSRDELNLLADLLIGCSTTGTGVSTCRTSHISHRLSTRGCCRSWRSLRSQCWFWSRAAPGIPALTSDMTWLTALAAFSIARHSLAR